MRIFTILLAFVGVTLADERPNFVFFITDDVSAEDLGCYGSEFAQTPNLDRMAAEGLRFTNAYLSISSCSPSRCSIVTGRYPHNTGAPELHTSLPKTQTTFVQALQSSGYHTVISGKNHMGKAPDLGFDVSSGGKGPGKEEDWVKLLAERPTDKPFFCWFGSSDAHRGWQADDTAPTYDPEKVPVPPYLFDGPKTRKDLADYWHEVSRTDFYLGELRKELKRQGIEKNTYIIYCADNGRPFPR
jgi:N-sulfoglucosamine sulfohydrolase